MTTRRHYRAAMTLLFCLAAFAFGFAGEQLFGLNGWSLLFTGSILLMILMIGAAIGMRG